MKEDAARRKDFLKGLKKRSLTGTQLFVGDKNVGLVEAITEIFPKAEYQRCTVHFYQNVFIKVPRKKRREVAAMLKVVHTQEDKEEALEKAKSV